MTIQYRKPSQLSESSKTAFRDALGVTATDENNFASWASWLKSYDSTLIPKGFARVGQSTPAFTLNHTYKPVESGTIFGETIPSNFEDYILVGNGSNSYTVETITNRTDYLGVALPSTTPINNPKVGDFYIASTLGTYTNFSGYIIAEPRIIIFRWSGAAWVGSTVTSFTEQFSADESIAVANVFATAKTEYTDSDANTILKASGTTEAFSGYKTSQFLTNSSASGFKFYEADFNSVVGNTFANLVYYDANGVKIKSYRLEGKRIVAVPYGYQIKICTNNTAIYEVTSIAGNELIDDIPVGVEELVLANNLRLTSKTAYTSTTDSKLLYANGTLLTVSGWKTSDYITADSATQTKYISATFNDALQSITANVVLYDENNRRVKSYRFKGDRCIAVRQPYKVKISVESAVSIYTGTAVETYKTALDTIENTKLEQAWLDKDNSSGLTTTAWVQAWGAIKGFHLEVDESLASNDFRINTFCTVPTSLSESIYGWKFELRDATSSVYWKCELDKNAIHTGLQLLTGTSTDGLRTARVLVNWDELPNPYQLFSGVTIKIKPFASVRVQEAYLNKISRNYDDAKLTRSIAWFGTSIPNYGLTTNDSYPQLVAKKLGMTCYNEAIAGSPARAGGNNTAGNYGLFKGLHSSTLLKALSHTIAEKQQLMDYWQTGLDENGDIGGVGTYGYRDFQLDYVADWATVGTAADILGWSYENKIIAKYLDTTSEDYIATPEYFVFDHGHNDLAYSTYDTDTASAIAVPSTRDDRTTFVGAMNYLVDRILEYNPRARIMFIGHYETDRKTNIYQGQETLFSYWNFPALKLWEKLGFSQQEVDTTGYWSSSTTWNNSGESLQTLTLTQIWMYDDLHPGSVPTRELFAGAIVPFIRDSY